MDLVYSLIYARIFIKKLRKAVLRKKSSVKFRKEFKTEKIDYEDEPDLNYFKTFYKYLVYNGKSKFWILLNLFVISISIYFLSDFWLGIWSIKYFKFDNNASYLIIFIAIAFGLIGYILIRDIVY